MSNRSKTFKHADLERAIRAARACDLPIVRSEITKDGRIILVHFNVDDTQTYAPANDRPPINEWDSYFNAEGKK